MQENSNKSNNQYGEMDLNQKSSKVQKKQKNKKSNISYFKERPEQLDYNIGHWTLWQNKRYIKFLRRCKKFLQSQQERKRKKIYMHMAKALLTRNQDQCRSHHQKYVQKYGNVQQIINALTQQCQKIQFPQQEKQQDDKQQQEALKLTNSGFQSSSIMRIQNKKIVFQISDQQIKVWTGIEEYK